MEDKLQFEILEDGTIKVLTEGISGVNHRNADDLLNLISKLTGGETTREKRKDRRAHSHAHTHTHQHNHS